MLVVMIISIIAAFAIPRFAEAKAAAGDAAAKADMKNAIISMERFSLGFGRYPVSTTELGQVGFSPTAAVTFTTFKLEIKNGSESVHMHVQHSASSNKWHAHYPFQGTEVQIR
jgi:type II secretory pathway pseudopilin PulG